MYYTKVPLSPAQPYIAGCMERPSKNSVLFDFEVPGKMETVIFQAVILEKASSILLIVRQRCKIRKLFPLSILKMRVNKQKHLGLEE